jgi:hypothetical protein
MRCPQVRDWLQRDLDGSAEPSADAAAHLQSCEACAAEAGRLKAIAAAVRAALPEAAVPIDFTDRVMVDAEEPTGDEALVEAVRPRWGRRLAFLALLVAIPAVAILLSRPRSVRVEGRLLVERDGRWVSVTEVADGGEFALDGFANAKTGALEVTALESTLLEADRRLHLKVGSALLEADEATTVETPLGEVRMNPGSACLVRIKGDGEEETMSLATLKRMTPALLAVTVLAGGVTVANAQGEHGAEKDETVEVRPGEPPVLDEKALSRELDALNEALTRINERMEAIARQIEASQKDAESTVRRATENAASALERAVRERGAHEAATLRYEMEKFARFLDNCSEMIEMRARNESDPFTGEEKNRLGARLGKYRESLEQLMEVLERHPEKAAEVMRMFEETRGSAVVFVREHDLHGAEKDRPFFGEDKKSRWEYKKFSSDPRSVDGLRDRIRNIEAQYRTLLQDRDAEVESVRHENAELRDKVQALEAELKRQKADPELRFVETFQETRWLPPTVAQLEQRLNEVRMQIVHAQDKGDTEAVARLKREEERLEIARVHTQEYWKLRRHYVECKAGGYEKDAKNLLEKIEKERAQLLQVLDK